MNKYAAMAALACTIPSLCLSAKDLEWSDDLPGRVNWTESAAQCREMGMRLPLRAEIEAAFKAGITAEWKYGLYWTSEEKQNDPPRAYVFNFDFKSAYDTRKSDRINARCVK